VKTLCKQLVAALGSYGIDAEVPTAGGNESVGWEVVVVVATNRYANAQGARRLAITLYFTPNGKWLCAIAAGAYEFDPNDAAVLSAVQQAAAVPNSNPAWMTEYDVDADSSTISLSVRTCVAGEGTLRNVLAPLLDDLINSADHYHDLMQVAAQQGQCLAELVQNSLYVAGLVEATSEEDEEHEEYAADADDEDEPEDENTGTTEPPQAKPKRQLPWE
jgi:hypothetical protein